MGHMVYHSPFRTNTAEKPPYHPYGGFYSIIFNNQLIQLGNMMRAGCSLVILPAWHTRRLPQRIS